MRKLTLFTSIVAMLLTLLSPPSYATDTREDLRLQTSTRVLEELFKTPDQNVPYWLLERAHAIAVVPQVIKVGLMAGGRRGKGALVVRKEDGRWSSPIFVNLTGGSFGFQFGVQATDVVLVFTTKASIEGIVGGKVTLGADASVAAGPVGRQTSAATDVGLNAQVYSYSRASGLFAGVALDGSALTIDGKSNELYYKRPGILASDLLQQDIPSMTPAGEAFLAAIQRSGGTPTRAAQAPGGASAPSNGGSNPAPQPAGEALTTYPMEDPTPGTEPPP
ncbi:MAG: YSC84-related protein [Steroidobacteraceae bacterium]